MSGVSFVALCLCLLGCAHALECPASLNLGEVGSCIFSPCSPSRGPTHCTNGMCFCNDGYCRYPASTVHVQSRYCVARIPGATCHLTRFCWSGGLHESFCEAGLCMCKWGYSPVLKEDKDGKEKYLCEPATSVLAAAVARNATKEELEMLMEHKEHSDRMGAQNFAIAVAWLCGAFALTIGAAVLLVMRRTPKATEVAGYRALLE